MSRHRGFAKAIESAKAGSPMMHRLMVGSQCLEWIATPGRSREELDALRARLKKVKPLEERRCLEQVISSEVLLFGRTGAETFDALGRWAQYKLHRNEPRLAFDIYRRTILLSKQSDVRSKTAALYRLLGRTCREMGDFAACRRVYDEGITAAKLEGNKKEAVLLRIAHANIYRLEGHLNIAEQLLEDVLAAARTNGDTSIEGRAAHDAGVVASELAVKNSDPRRFFTALALFGTALPGMREESERQRLRIDIAKAATHLGRGDLVPRILAPVLARPCERWLYGVAVINAMQWAQLADDEESFDRHRVSLTPAKLPALHRAHYWGTAAEGLHRFGRSDEAERAREKALSIVKRTGLRHIMEPSIVLKPPAGLNQALDALVERVDGDERNRAIIHHDPRYRRQAYRA